MGLDELPRVERHRASHQWLLSQPDWPKALFPDLHRLLHRQFVPVWVGTESRPSASLPCAPGRLRGRTATDDASNSRGYVPAREAWISFRSIWRDGHLRSRNRPDSRGLAHRQLFVALDFLYQRTC